MTGSQRRAPPSLEVSYEPTTSGRASRGSSMAARRATAARRVPAAAGCTGQRAVAGSAALSAAVGAAALRAAALRAAAGPAALPAGA
ncbi:MAG: hypothetical protein MUF54_20225, partial [Polyangiaceae bacterium]|nr:hypothetical protein [Polyangiaceae bacterium]